MRKIKLFTMSFVLTIVLLITFKVQAFQITDNQTVDANKKWTINFTGTVGYNDTTKQGIIITDSSGNKVNTTLELGSNNKSIIVDPPTDGYTSGESYTLTVKKQCHSSNGTQMKQDRIIHFTIKKVNLTIYAINDINASVKQNENYTLPTTVKALMNDEKTIENVPITWDKIVDTSKIGIFTFNGKVNGYNENIILTLVVTDSNSSIVTFKDTNLEQEIRTIINKPTGDIYKSDAEGITTLYIDEKNIKNISGIENLINLQNITLTNNEIKDITPLKNLINLKKLYLTDNQISDITPLKNLTSLQELSLTGNQINDISVLNNLTNLNQLFLANNEITNINTLSSLINLKWLALLGNSITDYSPTKTYYNNLEYKDFVINTNSVDESKIITEIDDVLNITWYKPYNYGESKIYLYIGQNSSNEIWLRQVFKYNKSGYIYIKKYIINIDGQIYTITPNIGDVKYNFNGGWTLAVYDINPNNDMLNLMKKIASSTKTIIRMQGDTNSVDFTISQTEKDNITNILNKYNQMLGK